MPKRPTKEKFSIEQLESEYRIAAPVAKSFCTEITRQISKLLEDQNISLGVPLQSRVKDWNSIVDKLGRINLNINGIKELNDLIGFRLILLFRRDLERVCEMLEQTFMVIDRYDTQERLSEDQFGYSSIHFIVRPPESWLALPTFASFEGLRAELQVRTLAQHIWAAASHILQYKKESSVPPSVKRSIFRVSALLETVDLEFERVLEERETYRQEEIATSEPTEPLNVDLLEKILDDLLPGDNKIAREPYGRILENLLAKNIDTKDKLIRLIEKHLESTLEQDRKAAAELLKKFPNAPEFMLEKARKGIVFAHIGIINTMLRDEFGEKAITTLKLDANLNKPKISESDKD